MVVVTDRDMNWLQWSLRVLNKRTVLATEIRPPHRPPHRPPRRPPHRPPRRPPHRPPRRRGGRISVASTVHDLKSLYFIIRSCSYTHLIAHTSTPIYCHFAVDNHIQGVALLVYTCQESWNGLQQGELKTYSV